MTYPFSSIRLRRPAMIKSTLAVASVALLVACGGGGGSDTDMTPEDPETPTPTGGRDPVPDIPTGPLDPSQERAAATTLVSRLAPEGNPVYTALSVVPTTGSAIYDGYFYGDLANRSDAVTDSLIGELELQAGFTSTSLTITGTVRNLADADDQDIAGSLSLSEGFLNRGGNPASDATLSAKISGTLTDDAGRDLVVGVRLEGDFLGATPDGVGGEALGSVTVGSADQNFDGGFIAVRR